MWISHIEIYSKKFRVGYRTNVPVIQLHVSSCFHGWYKWLQLSNLAYAQQGCAQLRARITLIEQNLVFTDTQALANGSFLSGNHSCRPCWIIFLCFHLSVCHTFFKVQNYIIRRDCWNHNLHTSTAHPLIENSSFWPLVKNHWLYANKMKTVLKALLRDISSFHKMLLICQKQPWLVAGFLNTSLERFCQQQQKRAVSILKINKYVGKMVSFTAHGVRACVRACVCMRACVCVRACVRAWVSVCLRVLWCVGKGGWKGWTHRGPAKQCTVTVPQLCSA